jgi:hypothetical protein
MTEDERPFIQIPLPPPEWEDYARWAKEKDQQEKENVDEDRGVIIIDI